MPHSPVPLSLPFTSGRTSVQGEMIVHSREPRVDEGGEDLGCPERADGVPPRFPRLYRCMATFEDDGAAFEVTKRFTDVARERKGRKG